MSTKPRTLFEKIWENHVVRAEPGQPALLYIDLHLVHEVTSPQAFDGLRLAGRKVRRPERTVATMDHNVPTTDRSLPIADDISRLQMEALAKNCAEFGITLYDINSPRQGIVHVIGPELGLTQPGQTVVCGDSHTSTHGAFGALAFGIGTSEVEHVLATQCLPQDRPKTMEIRVTGELGPGVTAKDIILAIIGKIGTAGATGYVVEYTGDAIKALSVEGRMTVCNMSIEAGARAGMIAPDEKDVRVSQRASLCAAGSGLGQGRRSLECAGNRRGCDLRHPGRDRRFRSRPVCLLGNLAGHGRASHKPRPGPAFYPGPCGPQGNGAGAGIHGPDPQHAADRNPAGHRLYWLLHQRTNRGFACRRRDSGGKQSQAGPACPLRSRLPCRQVAGRSRGVGCRLQGGWF